MENPPTDPVVEDYWMTTVAEIHAGVPCYHKTTIELKAPHEWIPQFNDLVRSKDKHFANKGVLVLLFVYQFKAIKGSVNVGQV